MKNFNVKAMGRIVAAAVFASGLMMAGCADKKCCSDSGACCKQKAAAKCSGDCSKDCAKTCGSAKKCPAGCTKPCCKKA